MNFDELRLLATQQHGLFTTAQAEKLNVPRLKVHRLAQAGTIRQVRRGVYSTDPFQVDHLEELRAAWLSLDPSKTVAERLRDEKCAAVAVTSAAYVHGVGNLMTRSHEFYSPKRKQSRADDIHILTRELPSADTETVEGLKVTTVTRTVLDLLADGEELEHINNLLVDAATKGLMVAWGRIRRETYKAEKTYGIESSKIFKALSASSSTEEQSVLAQSIMANNFPEFKRQISEQWSKALAPILDSIDLNLPKIPIPEFSFGVDLAQIIHATQAADKSVKQHWNHTNLMNIHNHGRGSTEQIRSVPESGNSLD